MKDISVIEKIEEVFFDIRSSIFSNEYKSDDISVVSLALKKYNSSSYEQNSLVINENNRMIENSLDKVSKLNPRLMVLLLPPPYDDRISSLVTKIKQYPNIVVGVYNVLFTRDFRYVPSVLQPLKDKLYSADIETFYFKNVSRSFPILDANFDIENENEAIDFLDIDQIYLKKSDFISANTYRFKSLDDKFLNLKSITNYSQKYKNIIPGILNSIDPYMIFKIFPALINNYQESTINKHLIIKYPSSLPEKIQYNDDVFSSKKISHIKNLIQDKIVFIGVDSNLRYRENYNYTSYAKVPMGNFFKLYRNISKLDLTAITLNNVVSNNSNSYLKIVRSRYIYILVTMIFSVVSLCIWKFKLLFSFISFIALWVFTVIFSSILMHQYSVYILLSIIFICSFFFFIIGGVLYIRQESIFLTKQKEQESLRLKISTEYDVFLRTLINHLKKIITNIQSLLNQIFSSNSSLKNNSMVSKIKLSSEDFDTYLSDLMEFISISKKNKRLSFKEVDINEVISNILFRLDTVISSKNLSIDNNTSSEDIIISDALLVEQILFNLVSNAAKYAFENTCITIDVERSKKYLTIYVSDEGVNISNEYRSKIFEKFYRIQNDTVYNIKGYGLGLYLSKYFCNLLHASIGLKDSENKLTTFFIKFKLNNKGVGK